MFETLPSRIGEVGDIYGVKISSLPPGARSYYDTLGDSVVWSVRYDFGMVSNTNTCLSFPAHVLRPRVVS